MNKGEQLAKGKVVPSKKTASSPEEFQRFSFLFRIQHMVLIASCITLIITGMPLRYPDSRWAEVFFHLTGGVAGSGIIHRIGAVGLIGVGVFHMVYIILIRDGRQNFLALLPRFQDVRDVFKNVWYFLGRSKTGAAFGRFSYIEKFDYWAVYWGMVIMITSGLILWFQDRAMSVMPKLFVDVAHEAHSDEALLATLAIIIWHFYNVHFSPDQFPMSWTWLNGRISREKMIHHHPLEYEKLVGEQVSSIASDEETDPVPAAKDE